MSFVSFVSRKEIAKLGQGQDISKRRINWKFLMPTTRIIVQKILDVQRRI